MIRTKKILLVIIIFLMIGCKKNSVTLDEFIKVGTDNGYILHEDKDGYEEHNYINEIYYAINRSNAYDIQFLELIDDNYAKRFFSLNALEIKDKITGKDYLKVKSLSNYELCHAENDTKYYLVLRSKNNIIYIDAPIEYINEIEEFLTDLDLEY